MGDCSCGGIKELLGMIGTPVDTTGTTLVSGTREANLFEEATVGIAGSGVAAVDAAAAAGLADFCKPR